MNADDFVVKNAPSTIRYIPNFISQEEEELLLEDIYSAPKPKWENLSNRRLQQWGGIVGKKSLISDSNIPKWLDDVIGRICEMKQTFPSSNRPNHVLINEYLPGQGIMPHTDGPAFYPLVSTISLRSHTLLNFYRHISANGDQKEHRVRVGSMLLEPRSLVLISEGAYAELLHGIDEVGKDCIDKTIFNLRDETLLNSTLERSTRISLTIRNVPVVNTKLLSVLCK